MVVEPLGKEALVPAATVIRRHLLALAHAETLGAAALKLLFL